MVVPVKVGLGARIGFERQGAERPDLVVSIGVEYERVVADGLPGVRDNGAVEDMFAVVLPG